MSLIGCWWLHDIWEGAWLPCLRRVGSRYPLLLLPARTSGSIVAVYNHNNEGRRVCLRLVHSIQDSWEPSMNVCLLFVCWALSCLWATYPLALRTITPHIVGGGGGSIAVIFHCFSLIERNYIGDIAFRVGRYQERRAAHMHEWYGTCTVWVLYSLVCSCCHSLTRCLVLLNSPVLSRSSIDALYHFSELRMDTKEERDDLAAANVPMAVKLNHQPASDRRTNNCTTATTRYISKEYLPMIDQELHDQPRVAVVRRYRSLTSNHSLRQQQSSAPTLRISCFSCIVFLLLMSNNLSWRMWTYGAVGEQYDDDTHRVSSISLFVYGRFKVPKIRTSWYSLAIIIMVSLEWFGGIRVGLMVELIVICTRSHSCASVCCHEPTKQIASGTVWSSDHKKSHSLYVVRISSIAVVAAVYFVHHVHVYVLLVADTYLSRCCCSHCRRWYQSKDDNHSTSLRDHSSCVIEVLDLQSDANSQEQRAHSSGVMRATRPIAPTNRTR